MSNGVETAVGDGRVSGSEGYDGRVVGGAEGFP